MLLYKELLIIKYSNESLIKYIKNIRDRRMYFIYLE